MKLIARRKFLDRPLLDAVQEHLFDFGWCLFFAGTNYAMIKVSAVEGWTRLSRQRISDELEQIALGELEPLQRQLEEELKSQLVVPQRKEERADQSDD